MLLKMSELAYFNLPDSPEEIGLAVFAVTPWLILRQGERC